VVELQAHGSPVILRQLVARCIALGARQATAGEFSQRAFLNGKLDLAQAEGDRRPDRRRRRTRRPRRPAFAGRACSRAGSRR
jgi:hypothetical protein